MSKPKDIEDLREWFESHLNRLNTMEDSPLRHSRVTCPCCGFPTLTARSTYEICRLCFWEDDGQDDKDANKVKGGPNQGYSLTQARQNFARSLTMYSPASKDHFKRETERRTVAYKRRLIKLYKSITAGDEAQIWQQIRQLEKKSRRAI